MSPDPVLTAPAIIQFHIAVALIALVLGPVALWRNRRDRLHKIIGYIWVTAMTAVAVSAFLIPSHFSSVGLGPIHLLAAYALVGLWVAMAAIFRGDIKTHRETMMNLYVRGIALAGAFNFLPGRSVQRALIPEAEVLGYAIIAAALIWAFGAPLLALIGSRRTV